MGNPRLRSLAGLYHTKAPSPLIMGVQSENRFIRDFFDAVFDGGMIRQSVHHAKIRAVTPRPPTGKYVARRFAVRTFFSRNGWLRRIARTEALRMCRRWRTSAALSKSRTGARELGVSLQSFSRLHHAKADERGAEVVADVPQHIQHRPLLAMGSRRECYAPRRSRRLGCWRFSASCNADRSISTMRAPGFWCSLKSIKNLRVKATLARPYCHLQGIGPARSMLAGVGIDAGRTIGTEFPH